jgi:hypothetical protein
MELAEVLGLLLFAAGGWFSWDSMKAREAANAAIRAACAADGLLFLDDTVGLESLRPVRDDDGHAALRRVYGFEYSDTGNNRRKATVTVFAGQVLVSPLYIGPRAVPAGETLH